MKYSTIIFIILTLLLLIPLTVSAYTGSFMILPAIAGGPTSTTITNFGLDTGNDNPQTIFTNLNYVYEVVIETNTAQSGPFLVKEEPFGNTPSFSFIVPQKINNDLISATITFWGPDQDTLTITHLHQNEDPELIDATKIEPIQYDSNGNILWQFQTTSFSDFFIGDSPPTPGPIPLAHVIALSVLSFSALLLFWGAHFGQKND